MSSQLVNGTVWTEQRTLRETRFCSLPITFLNLSRAMGLILMANCHSFFASFCILCSCDLDSSMKAMLSPVATVISRKMRQPRCTGLRLRRRSMILRTKDEKSPNACALEFCGCYDRLELSSLLRLVFMPSDVCPTSSISFLLCSIGPSSLPFVYDVDDMVKLVDE